MRNFIPANIHIERRTYVRAYGWTDGHVTTESSCMPIAMEALLRAQGPEEFRVIK